MTTEPTWGNDADIWARCARAEAMVSRVRALAEEWDDSTATGHPRCQSDEDCVGCAAAELRAALGDPA